MKIIKQKSLKPFGSGTSCIDALNGDCIRNLSVEECIKITEESYESQCGIHVEVKDSAIGSYCIPLNTNSWTNIDISPSLVRTKNKSLLSTTNNVDTTFFYNDKVYGVPSKELLSQMLFDFDAVQLRYRDTDGTMLTMDERFTFVPKTSFDMLFQSYWNFRYGKIHRCVVNGKYKFFRGRESLTMSVEKPYTKFLWNNFTTSYGFTIFSNFFITSVDKNRLFLNVNEPVYIFHQTVRLGKKTYLYVDPKTKLLNIDMTGEKKSVFFIYKSFDLPNAYPIKLYFNVTDTMTENMEVYLKELEEKFTETNPFTKEISYKTQITPVNDYNYAWVWTSVSILIVLLLMNVFIYFKNNLLRS